MSDRDLSPRQQQILDAIRRWNAEHSYPPTVREIGAMVGLSSPSSVAHHLADLRGRGLISRETGTARTLGLRAADETAAAPVESVTSVPLLGEIAAGAPIVADEQLEETWSLPTSLVGHGELFALWVRGDSMIDAAICDGDVVVVRRQQHAENGQIVAALLDGEATVKTLEITDGHVRLLPHNPSYEPIDADGAVILGRVVSVLRRIP